MNTMGFVAQEIRELYLSQFEKRDPYQCHAMSPRVLLLRLSSRLIDKYTQRGEGDIGSFSEEEEEWEVGRNDSGDWDTSLLEPIVQITENSRAAAIQSVGRRRGTEGYRRACLDDDMQTIKDEPLEPDPLAPPMTVLPASLLQMQAQAQVLLQMQAMQANLLPIYMQQQMATAAAQQLHAQAAEKKSSNNSGSGTSGGDGNGGSSGSGGGRDTVVEPPVQVKQEKEDPPAEDMVVTTGLEDFTAPPPPPPPTQGAEEEVRLDDLPKDLRGLSSLLLELNKKNAQYNDEIQSIRSDYERRMSRVSADKRVNDAKIAKVLSLIQNWKD